MNKIILLPPEISQKIAAGEVIERPFSVVKELIENSLDAAAKNIRIELQAGGKRLIRVQDDGAGMSREDALLSFERHSTSKISNEEDLARIHTLGFRGEALASISAVSKLTLKTSDGAQEGGTQVEHEAGRLIGVSDVASPKGTAVEVRDLFFNLPARLKFLRSDQAELGMTVKYVTNLALAFPEVRFSLVHGKREILNCSAVGSLRERIFQLYGKTAIEKLMEIDFKDGERRIFGYSSRPPSGRSDKGLQLFFVNKRPVKDKILLAALNQAYKGFLEKETYPEAFLFLSLPYHEVDVNVHPAKAEVRFLDSQVVFRLVLKGVESAVLGESAVKEIYPFQEERKPERRAEEAGRFQVFKPPRQEDQREAVETAEKRLFLPSDEAGKIGAHPFVIGQYENAYIIAGGAGGLFIIDQHNAHERVLYERYREIDRNRKWPRKLSLVPVLFDLSPSQVLSLEANQTLLEEAGFRVEAMGGRSFVLKEFPDIFDEMKAKDAFLSLLEEMKEERGEDKRDRLLSTLACKTAVKAGEPLPREKMAYLVEELFRTSNPSVCPHGRPIMVKVEKSQIEKGLKRPVS